MRPVRGARADVEAGSSRSSRVAKSIDQHEHEQEPGLWR